MALLLSQLLALVVMSQLCRAAERRLRLARYEFFPELMFVEDSAERDKIWDGTNALRYEMPLNILLGVLWLLSYLVVWVTARRWLSLQSPLVKCVAWGALGLGVAVAVPCVRTWLLRRRIAHRIRLALRKRKIPVCMVCGYNLTGLTEARCPECGQRYDLSLCPECGGVGYESRTWQLLAGLTALVAWGAITGLFAIRLSQRVPPLPDERYEFIVWQVPAPIGILGVGFVVSYLTAGRRRMCSCCRGCGRIGATVPAIPQGGPPDPAPRAGSSTPAHTPPPPAPASAPAADP